MPVNTLSLTVVNADTALLEATGVMQQLLAAPITDHLHIVDAIYVANIHATVIGWVTIVIRDEAASPTLNFIFLNQKRLALKDDYNILLGRSLYLREGRSLWVQANQANNVNVSAPYSDCV